MTPTQTPDCNRDARASFAGPNGSVEMTAEQWNEEYRRLCANDPAVHGQLLPNPQNVAFIQRVMDESAACARREALMVATKAYRPPNAKVSSGNNPR